MFKETFQQKSRYWLRKLDIKFNEKYFVCKCSNVSTLNLNMLPIFLQNMYPIMVKITGTYSIVTLIPF